MCGIYGLFGNTNKTVKNIFIDELDHRGPDDNGIYNDKINNIILGHTRLSIIDLSNNAHQPMFDKTNKYIIVYNGEIYNFREIKEELKAKGYIFYTNSDTEVVLNSYIEWNEKCLGKFRGMFAFAIYNKYKQQLFLARDRFGIKPLIYTFSNKQFIFTSELKPLINSDLINKKLDLESVSDYFTMGSISQPKTILKNVFHLMPGHFMKVNTKLNYTIEKYYDLANEIKKYPIITDYREAVLKIREELEAATKYHMVADVEVGAFLSGGIDSTSVVALMGQISGKTINTFSMGFKNNNEVEDESEIAEKNALHMGTVHHNIIIDDKYIYDIFDDFIESLDQPSIDGINTYIISKETSKNLKVALSGLGGDEIFAGYPHFKKIIDYTSKKDSLLSITGKMLNRIKLNKFTYYYNFYGLHKEHALNLSRRVNTNIKKILNESYMHDPINIFKDFSPIQKISLSEINNYLLNTLLRDNDILSMAHSLEIRPILLDHKLVELALSLPDEFKIRNGQQKAVFKDAVKDLIPEETWQRKKTGFEMPFATWMNSGLNERFINLLDGSFAKDLFKMKYSRSLKKRAEQRTLKRKDWLDLVFLNWMDKYKVGI